MAGRSALHISITLSLLLHLSGCGLIGTFTSANEDRNESPPREFRAAWVATVANINWPSEPGLSVHQQKAEATELLDLLEENNFNAVIFQVRPQADALYKSDLEPWSYYLTGEQGKAPSPSYDPLEFWIREAHKRKLELHVWLNPYRAHHVAGGPVSEHSVVNTLPELVVELESGYYWFDPSLEATRTHSKSVVMDIVTRYDIDGVHFDDYFYPYPSYHNGKDFPDQRSWTAYREAGGTLSRGDWRRNAVNTFIQDVYTSVKDLKPHVKFGISPFGIWRPGYPESVAGFDQYDVLYADARKWLNEGWVDYFTPQLYWPVNQIPQSFPVLLKWWSDENDKNRHLWPGMSIGRLQGDQQKDEVLNQIMISRAITDQSPGTVHWSIQPLVNDSTLRHTLRNTVYSEEALVPPSPWLSTSSSKRIQADFPVSRNQNHLLISASLPLAKVHNWVVTTTYSGRKKHYIHSKYRTEQKLPYAIAIPAGEGNLPEIGLLEEIRISITDRNGILHTVKTYPVLESD